MSSELQHRESYRFMPKLLIPIKGVKICYMQNAIIVLYMRITFNMKYSNNVNDTLTYIILY